MSVKPPSSSRRWPSLPLLLLRLIVIWTSEQWWSVPGVCSSIKSKSVKRRVSRTKWLLSLMMPKEHFKVSSVTPEHVNHSIASSYIYRQRGGLFLLCASYIAECVCVCIWSLCVHDSESFDVFGLSLFLWDNLSCLLAPRVWKHNTQISPPPCRMQ